MNAWSPDLEGVLEGIRQNSVIMSNEHKKNYIYLKGQLRYFKECSSRKEYKYLIISNKK